VYILYCTLNLSILVQFSFQKNIPSNLVLSKANRPIIRVFKLFRMNYCVPFASTWVHPQFLVESVMLIFLIFLPRSKNAERRSSCFVNKCYRKPKGQSRMDNPETLATLRPQDTGRRQRKQKYTTQNIKKMSITDSTKNWG
jgi:hypothetical protein